MSVLVVGLTCVIRVEDVFVADIRGVDSARIWAVRPQRVVDGEDQARADSEDGRGRRLERKGIADRTRDEGRGDGLRRSVAPSRC